MKESVIAKLVIVWIAVLIAAAVFASGCSSTSKTTKGAGIGAGAGAILGGIIDDNTARGAIVGAAIGGTAGAIIGSQMDKQARELEEELEGAAVQRVGEGIIITFGSQILFDFDSAAIRSDAETNLEDLAESLTEYDNTEVLVVGHTDATGSADYNQSLSERRARAAVAVLVTSGVSPDRLNAVGRGEDEPVASNETDAGRQLNRRVEVAIFASEDYRDRVQS